MILFVRTDDPLADFDRYQAEEERWLKKRPRCSECDKHIQDEFAYYINDEWICPECMSEYLKPVDEDF